MNPGTTIGKYEIIGRIGQGGMADVYQAKDTELGRVVALKLLPPEFARDPERVARFMKEVRNSAAITHPNVVPVYDVGEGDGIYFYTMAYLPGGDLKEKIRSGMSPDKALGLLRQMADALGAAHAKGIVHRDVKPENIMFDDAGRPILTDLGIARAVTGGTRMTKTGMSIGTPHYMSPEQARGKSVDGRSDIYSLGIVFYEMLTGRVPYEAEETFAVGLKHINDPVPMLPEHFNKYQPLIHAMLAKDPAHRYQENAALIQDIDRVTSGAKALGSGNGPASASGGSRKKEQQSSGALKGLLIGALAALIAAAGVYWYMENNRPKIRQGGGGGLISPSPVPVAPEPRRAGSLKVTTAPPGASITLDGTSRGTAPLDLMDLSPGTHRVDAALSGYVSQSRTASITGGKQAVTHFNLEAASTSGHLTVVPVPSGSRVRILNINPVYQDGIELDPGQYHIEVSHLGYATNIQWIEIGKCEDKQIRVELEKADLKPGQIWKEPTTGMKFVWVPKGCYQMGQTQGEKAYLIKKRGQEKYDRWYKRELPRHKVCVDGFWMGRTEVTRGQFRKFVNAENYQTDAQKKGKANIRNKSTDWKWKEVTGHNWKNPGFSQTDAHPVVTVSWNDAKAFARWMSVVSNQKVCLPTEAQWEYAARAGTTTMRYWGDNESRACNYGNVQGKTPFPGNPKKRWTTRFECDDGYFFTAPVGRFRPNSFGLYDMLGNVWEWCEDVYNSKAYDRHAANNPVITSGGSLRVNRGGGWGNGPGCVRAADRNRSRADSRLASMGFRLCVPKVRQ